MSFRVTSGSVKINPQFTEKGVKIFHLFMSFSPAADARHALAVLSCCESPLFCLPCSQTGLRRCHSVSFSTPLAALIYLGLVHVDKDWLKMLLNTSATLSAWSTIWIDTTERFPDPGCANRKHNIVDGTLNQSE